jgi:hypothetical protein
MSKTVPSAILTVFALLMILEGFLDVAIFRTMAGEVRLWSIIISAFALGLASVNLARFHVIRVARQTKGWHHNVVCLVMMAGFGLGGVFLGPRNPVYKFYFDNLYSPLSVAVVGLTIFFIATAALRAVTVRNPEAGVLLAAAVIIMLANIPLGDAISTQIPAIADYINKIPNMAGQRGILITSAIGSIAFGLRVLLGLERTQFGATGGG